MAKRIGRLREAALLKSMKKSVNMAGSTITGVTLTTPTVTSPTITGADVTANVITIDNSGEPVEVTMTTKTYPPGSIIYVEAGISQGY